MRLVVKQADRQVTELQFTRGPVRIGRGQDNQIVLPDPAVSRQHAMLYRANGNKWVIEDLDSANKTYLNEQAIDEAQIEHGDSLRIGHFTIEVDLTANGNAPEPIHLDDTLAPVESQHQTIVRKPDAEHAPDIILPASRAKDYLRATEEICQSDSPDKILDTLIGILLKQFHAHRAWGALRNEPQGPMTYHAGRTRHQQKLKAEDIELADKIKQAVEDGTFLLLPQIRGRTTRLPIASAMVAPVTDLTGCFGVLYLDNTADDKPYTRSDLDYLMLLAIHAAVILENF